MHQIEEIWKDDASLLRKQIELVVTALQLGAYSLPKKILESEKLHYFIIDVLKRDFVRCLDDIRKGLVICYKSQNCAGNCFS